MSDSKLPNAQSGHDRVQPETPYHSLNRRIAVYVETFDPPCRYHRDVVAALLRIGFDSVIVCPKFASREKGEHEHASPRHRAALASLGFRDLERVEVDYADLSDGRATSMQVLAQRYQDRGEVWFVVDSGPFCDASVHPSQTHSEPTSGQRHGKDARYVILCSPEEQPWVERLPAVHKLLRVPKGLSSGELRACVYAGQSISQWTTTDVEHYIRRHLLFLPYSKRRYASFCLESPRLRIVHDSRNSRSCELAQIYRRYEASCPNLVLVLGGDGTMLHAIREHWRLRVPFLGLNTGHLGFLMNESLPSHLEQLALVSYSLPLLRVDAKAAERTHEMELAFSDAWLERAEGQAAWIRVDVDGETRVSKVVGDGLLVSTAAGSSAYARAMGAVPVPIDTPTLTLAGSNIFLPRFWKPMALADDSVVTLVSLDDVNKRPLRGYVDGKPLGPVCEMRIKQSVTASVELAFTTEFDPSARLLRSLFPPEEASQL